MKQIRFQYIFFFLFLFSVLLNGMENSLPAKDDHKHEEKDSYDHKSKDEHRHDESEKESGAHQSEENNQVGPGKGIISASPSEGIRISPEAEKNFNILRIPVAAKTQLVIPRSAIVTSGVEVNLYRYRNGNYKRIDFNLIDKKATEVIIQSKDLKSGDEIVIRGMGFLRIAEISAFGGAPDGHSH